MVKKWLILGILIPVIPVIQAKVDSVLLATTINYPDALVAKVVGQKAGIPVLLTDKMRLSTDLKSTLQELDPETIYLAGGPAVISTQVEAELKEDYEVVRLWGITRYKTSTEIAEHFWPTGSDKVVITYDLVGSPRGNQYKIVNAAKELAEELEVPLILSPKDELTPEIAKTLDSLGVNETIIVGREISEEVRSKLESMGINTSRVAGRNLTETEKEVRKRIGKRPLVLVCTFAPEHAALAAAEWSGIVKFVRSCEDLPVAEITEAMEANRTVMVVGVPWIAEEVCNCTREIYPDAICPSVVNRDLKVVKERIEEFRERHKKYKAKMLTNLTALENRAEAELEIAKNLYSRSQDRVDRAIKQNVSAKLLEDLKDKLEKINQTIAKAQEELAEGDYLDVFDLVREIKSISRDIIWELREKLIEEYRDEIELEMESIEEMVERMEWKVNQTKIGIGRLRRRGINTTAAEHLHKRLEKLKGRLRETLEEGNYGMVAKYAKWMEELNKELSEQTKEAEEAEEFEVEELEKRIWWVNETEREFEHEMEWWHRHKGIVRD